MAHRETGHANFGALELGTAQLSLTRGQPAQALEQLRRAEAIFAVAAEKNPLHARTLGWMARVELQLGDAMAAGQRAEAAVAAARAAAEGFAHTAWLGEALAVLAHVQQAQGAKGRAAQTLRDAHAQLQATLGDEAPATREVRTLLAGA